MINVVISQVTLLLKGRDVQLIHNIPEEIRRLIVYGDEARVQQVLTTFLSSMVNHVQEGWVDFQLQPIMQQISGDTTNLPFEFRYASTFPHIFQILICDNNVYLILVLNDQYICSIGKNRLVSTVFFSFFFKQ